MTRQSKLRLHLNSSHIHDYMTSTQNPTCEQLNMAMEPINGGVMGGP